MEPLPIACSLEERELAARADAWRSVIARRSGFEEIAGGLRFTFEPDASLVRELHDLIDAEARCCPWMSLTLEDGAPAVLSVTAEGEGERAVRELFVPG